MRWNAAAFGVRFGAGALAFAALDWLDVDRPVADVVARGQAYLAYRVLRHATSDAHLSGSVIQLGSGALDVTKDCTGITLVALLAVAMIAYPAGWRRRSVGVALLLPIVFVLDVLRVVSLGVALPYGRAVFDLLHHVVWEGVFVLVLLAYWLAWMRE